MKRLLNWLDDRTGSKALLHEALYERVPGGARWRYVWGSTLTFAITVQFITGVVLWMNYSAGAQSAWESVYYIQDVLPGGWILVCTSFQHRTYYRSFPLKYPCKRAENGQWLKLSYS